MTTKEGIPQFMGARIKRREDPTLITGQGKYVADIRLDGLLHMAVLRSPYAHAAILSIDTGQAEAMPGVVAVYTAKDINPNLATLLPMAIGKGPEFKELRNPGRRPLTEDRARHMGDAVAVVVAEDRYQAADALDAIFVDYDMLDVTVNPEAALADDAPLLHPSLGSNLAYHWFKEGGDVEAAFAQADHVTEIRIVNQRVIPSAMEPRAVTASYNAETKALTLWTTTQIPHFVKKEIAEVLGFPEEKMRVIAPEVGGGFGAKGTIYAEEALVPFLAMKLGRPVHWAATRGEDNVATIHGRDQIDIVRLAAGKNGRVLAADLQIIADLGAYYSRVTPAIGPLTATMMTGVYEIPNARVEIKGVFTNKVPMEPYRGAGRPEAAYLIERAMDQLAGELGIDPAELRRRNFIPSNSFPYNTPSGGIYDSGEYEMNLDRALDLAGYAGLRAEQAKRRQEGGKLLGIGLSTYVEICGMGGFELGSVTMDGEGKVAVLTGTSPHGQGHQTTWSQIVADVLQVPMEDIAIKHGDTDVVPRGEGTFGSRSAPLGGSAVLISSERVRDKGLSIAAHLLEAAVADMMLIDGAFQVRGVPERAVTWREVAQAAQDVSLPEDLRGGLTADQDFAPKGETYPFGTHICVVEIDPETGFLEVIRYLTVDDCGKVINPLIVEGQVHGGIAQGMGQALFEGVVYDEIGNLLTGSFMDYAMPRAHRLPSFETHRTETPSPLNPLGVKGIGEAATIGSTPAVTNAVVDALSHLGVTHLDMPLTSQKIWGAIRAAA